MIVRWIFTIIVLIAYQLTFAQDLNYARYLVDTLASPSLEGRGYVNAGDARAATFIAGEFRRAGLRTFTQDYFQPFTLPMNTFPGTLHVKVNDSLLIPGIDFAVASYSCPAAGEYPLYWLPPDTTDFVLDSVIALGLDLSGKVVVISNERYQSGSMIRLEAAGYIILTDQKIGWHVSKGYEVKSYFVLQMRRSIIPENCSFISLYLPSFFIPAYPVQNVIGYVEGSKYPDHYICITAHYDHLGRMGAETYFPGANDNASGTAMMIDLARHYNLPENRPKYSIVFIAFAGEEAGLKGSFHYVSAPLFPLEKIRFLINLDMVGSGSEGINVVNGTVFSQEFSTLKKINEKKKWLHQVSERGESANSDHFPFYQQGVASFFIYTLGPESKEYHNVYDTPSNVPFTEYEDLFRLITRFIKTF